MNMHINKRKGYLMTILGGAFWAVSGTMGQYLFRSKGITSEWLVPIRLLTAGLIILALTAVRYKSKVLCVWKKSSDIFDLIIFSIFGTAMCQYAYFTSIHESNAATATVLCYTSPVLIVIYIAIKKWKLPNIYQLISILLVVAGTFLCATHGNIYSLTLTKPALFWGFLSALAFCIYTVQPRRLLLRHNTLIIIGWGMLLGGILLSIIFKFWQKEQVWDVETFFAMAIIIIFGTVLSFYFYLEGTKIIGETKASIMSSVEPVVSTILSTIWLKVEFQILDLIGFALIILTVFIMGLEKE